MFCYAGIICGEGAARVQEARKQRQLTKWASRDACYMAMAYYLAGGGITTHSGSSNSPITRISQKGAALLMISFTLGAG